jgi:hypothetical protein
VRLRRRLRRLVRRTQADPNASGRRDDETVMNTDRKGLSIVQLTCSGRPNMAPRLRNRAISRGGDEKP